MQLGEMTGKQALDAMEELCSSTGDCDRCGIGEKNCEFTDWLDDLVGRRVTCRSGARIDAGQTRLDSIRDHCRANRAEAGSPEYVDCNDCDIGHLVDELPDLNIEMPEPKPEEDNVMHPAHYTQGGIEALDAIEAAVSDKTGMEAMLAGNIIKYLWRYRAKDGVQDLRKAQFYLVRLINIVDG